MDRRLDRRAILRAAAATAAAAIVWPRSARASSLWPPTPVEKQLVTRLERPYCAEPRLADLVRDPITALEHFYVLDHGAVPAVDVTRYRLRVDGLVDRALAFSLPQLLATVDDVELVATLMCAGNRRDDHDARRPVADPLIWSAGAIGTARWRGPTLASLLRHAGLRSGARHVWFEGLDGAPRGFGGSIPLARVLSRDAPPVILAHHMNGVPLPRVHGYPLRALCPGYIGARSVKWLGRIAVRDRPSDNPHFASAHRVRSDRRTSPREVPPIYGYPQNSAVCVPRSGAVVAAGAVPVLGYAVPASEGADLDRVELSSDGGASFQRAELGPRIGPRAWRLFRGALTLAPGPAEIVCRAVDQRGHAQPAEVAWNTGGYLYAGWDRVRIAVR